MGLTSKNKVKNFIFQKLLIFGLMVSSMLQAQRVSNLKAEFRNCTAVLKFKLTSANPVDLTLKYSGDGGKTWLACTTVSGDITGQTSGSKQIVWDCYADNIRWGLVKFKVEAPGSGCSNSFMEMVEVAGGTFQMGSLTDGPNEQPVHAVTLADYCIGKYEVTQQQWFDVMGGYPQDEPKVIYGAGSNYPVYYISWDDITGTTGSVAYSYNGVDYRTDGFCYKLSYKVDPELSYKYRLPTEAEWEYAARGGNQSKGYLYSGSNTIDDVAWYDGALTHEVGSKLANELGIYDMTGNVSEWCSDWYGPYNSSAQTNPVGAASGIYRIRRGGGWNNEPGLCTVTLRSFNNTGVGYFSYIGFRLVVDP